MNNQRGFATLELILVILIIAVLSTVALPKAARMVDVAALDYEMKIFLSTLDLAKSMNKNATYNAGIFKTVNSTGNANALQVNITNTGYQILRDGKTVFDQHKMPEGFSIQGASIIYFSQSNNGHIKMTSRQNFNRYIIFDNVGRWRGDIMAPK